MFVEVCLKLAFVINGTILSTPSLIKKDASVSNMKSELVTIISASKFSTSTIIPGSTSKSTV